VNESGENEVDSSVLDSTEKLQPPDTPKPVAKEQGGRGAEGDLFSPLSWLALPWHLVMVVFYVLLLRAGAGLMTKELGKALDPEGKIPWFGGRFKFLTHINEWIQLGFFTIQLLADLSPGPFKKRLQRLSDLLFTTLAFPLAMFVTFSFWGLYALDRKLVYPEVFDEFVPFYINHFWHTTILVWVLFEVYLHHHHFPSTAWAVASVFVYGSAYNAWVVYIYIMTEWWCYPFMRLLPPYLMALFFASCMFVCLGFYFLGRYIAKLRWGRITLLDGY
jgi:hypothetical protein